VARSPCQATLSAVTVLGAESPLRGERWPVVVGIGSVRLRRRAARDVRGRAHRDRVVGTLRQRRPPSARGAFQQSGLGRSPRRAPRNRPAARLARRSPTGARQRGRQGRRHRRRITRSDTATARSRSTQRTCRMLQFEHLVLEADDHLDPKGDRPDADAFKRVPAAAAASNLSRAGVLSKRQFVGRRLAASVDEAFTVVHVLGSTMDHGLANLLRSRVNQTNTPELEPPRSSPACAGGDASSPGGDDFGTGGVHRCVARSRGRQLTDGGLTTTRRCCRGRTGAVPAGLPPRRPALSR
jgi:hypothetical protein